MTANDPWHEIGNIKPSTFISSGNGTDNSSFLGVMTAAASGKAILGSGGAEKDARIVVRAIIKQECSGISDELLNFVADSILVMLMSGVSLKVTGDAASLILNEKDIVSEYDLKILHGLRTKLSEEKQGICLLESADSENMECILTNDSGNTRNNSIDTYNTSESSDDSSFVVNCRVVASWDRAFRGSHSSDPQDEEHRLYMQPTSVEDVIEIGVRMTSSNIMKNSSISLSNCSQNPLVSNITEQDSFGPVGSSISTVCTKNTSHALSGSHEEAQESILNSANSRPEQFPTENSIRREKVYENFLGEEYVNCYDLPVAKQPIKGSKYPRKDNISSKSLSETQRGPECMSNKSKMLQIRIPSDINRMCMKNKFELDDKVENGNEFTKSLSLEINLPKNLLKDEEVLDRLKSEVAALVYSTLMKEESVASSVTNDKYIFRHIFSGMVDIASIVLSSGGSEESAKHVTYRLLC